MALMELKEACMELSPKFSIRKGAVQGENFEEGVESEQRVENLAQCKSDSNDYSTYI